MMGSVRSNVSIAFGLVTCPVNIVSAVVKSEDSKLVCLGTEGEAHPVTKTTSRLFCPTCQNEDRTSFKRAKDMGGGQLVVLSDEVVAEANTLPPGVKNTLTLTCHKAEEVAETSLPGKNFYYLAQQPVAAHPYAMLLDLVQRRTDLVFTCEFAVRSVAAIYQLGVLNGSLVLKEVARPDTVQAPPSVQPEFPAGYAGQADAVADMLTTPFDPAQYTDRRKATIDAFLATQTGEDTLPAVEKPVAPVMDLMSQLQASVAAAKPKRPAKKTVAAKQRRKAS